MKTEYKNSISNALYLLLVQGVNYLIPLIILPYLLKVLGPEKYGIIGLGQAFVQYFILIVEFGFNLSAVKRVALHRYDPEKLSVIFWSTLGAKCILCAFCFLLHMLLVHTVPLFQVHSQVLNVFFLMVIGNVLFPIWFFQGIGKMRLLAVVNFLVRLSILPIILVYVKKPSDYVLAAQLQSMVYLLSGLLSFIFIFWFKYVKFSPISIKTMLAEAKESWLVFVSSAAINVYTSSFVVILGFFATTTAIGYYTAAERVMRVSCYLIAAPLSQAFFPKISELVVSNRSKAIDMLWVVLKITILSMSAVAVCLFFLGGLVTKLLGESYHNCIYLLKIMCLVPLLIGLGGVLGQLGLLAFGEKEMYAKAYLITGACSIVLVFVLTYMFKEVGTAWALLATELIVVGLLAKYARDGIFKKQF
ncbi:flippase [Parasediminibacterium sp. JCM 36343]|uniref:flippase n=1 Tax=Parasediminibacterium sp. JCM 36343 TaxID=3374279 RepID=UPI003979B05E